MKSTSCRRASTARRSSTSTPSKAVEITWSHRLTAAATLSSTSTSPVRHSLKALRNSSEAAISSNWE